MKISIESLDATLQEEQQEEKLEEKLEEQKDAVVNEESSDDEAAKKGKGKSKDKKFKKFKKLDKLVSRKINKAVEEQVALMLPCIINQVLNAKEPLKKIEVEGVVHENTTCNGCSITPIKGIRYKSMECENFNLCEICEAKIEHPYDLLKIRKPRQSKDHNDMKLMQKIMRAGRKMMKKINRSSSSSSDEEHSKRKHKKHGKHGKSHKKHDRSSSSEEEHSKDKRRHGKCHKKRQEFKEKNKEKVLERRANKMVKAFGGEASDYEGFVDETFDLSIKETIAKYAKDKNINLLEERAQNKNQKRLRKLALFFNKDES